jgi:hypothetical protein
VDQRPQNGGPHAQGAGGEEGVDCVIDRDVEPSWVAADGLAHEDECGEAGDHVGDFMGEIVCGPFWEMEPVSMNLR